MAITKSAKKALRQDKKRRIKNIRQKLALKELLKEIKSLVEQKKTE